MARLLTFTSTIPSGVKLALPNVEVTVVTNTNAINNRKIESTIFPEIFNDGSI